MIPANVKKSIEKTSDDGDKLVAVGLGMSIFVNVPWTAAAETALRSLETWRALGNEKELKYYATENMSKHRKISSTTWAMPATWLKKGAPPRETVCLELKGGVTLESASAPFYEIYGLEASNEERTEFDVSAVTLSFDDTVDLAQFEKAFIDLCSTPSLVSALAGYQMHCSRYNEEEAQTHAWKMGMRYRGIDIARAQDDSMSVGRDGLKGIGWLTAIGETILADLGGKTKLKKVLPKGVEMVDLAAGVMFRVGSAPSLLDRNKQGEGGVERALYGVLQPAILRVADRCSPIGLEGEDFEEKTDPLMKRFSNG